MSTRVPHRFSRNNAAGALAAPSRTIGLAAFAASLFSACSQPVQAPGEEHTSAAEAAPPRTSDARRFDKKAAAALSLTSPATADFDSEYTRAVACTSAIRTTIGIVREYRGGLEAREMEALARAEQLYLSNAKKYGRAESVSEVGVQSAINEAVERGRQSAAAQVQLSLACLQRLGS